MGVLSSIPAGPAKKYHSGALGDLDAMTWNQFRALNPCERYRLLSLAMRYKPYQTENVERHHEMTPYTERRADHYQYCMYYSFFSQYRSALKDAMFGNQITTQKYSCIFTDAQERDFVVLSKTVEFEGRVVHATMMLDSESEMRPNQIKYIQVTPTHAAIKEHVIAASTTLAEYHFQLAALLSGAYEQPVREAPDARKRQTNEKLSEFIKTNAKLAGGYIELAKPIRAMGQSDDFGEGEHKTVGEVLSQLLEHYIQPFREFFKTQGRQDVLSRLGME